MNESFQKPLEGGVKEKNNKLEIAQKVEGIIALAKELNESGEAFPFSGIGADDYEKLKKIGEEFSDYTAPIDDLIKRFEDEGLKIVLGKYPDSGNVFALPSLSNDIENDSIPPGILQIKETMDERLKKLILMSREYFALVDKG